MIPNFYSPQRSTRTDLFDLLPSIAAEAAYAIHAKTDGVDEGLIQAQLIAVMAAAVAPHFTLTLPNWKPIPLGIPVICIGRSGVSKTPVYLEVSRPLKAFAEERERQFMDEVKNHHVEEALRVFRVDELRKEKQRKERSGENWQQVELELRRMLSPLPQPELRSRLHEEMDFEKLIHLLAGENEAVDFMFNEGDQAINSLLFRRHAGDFNNLHDGLARLETPQQRRKATRATNSNVSMLFLVRESALKRYLPVEKDGNVEKSPLVDLGFFARFIVYVVDQLPRASGLWAPADPESAIDAFSQRILDLLWSHHAKLVEGDTSRVNLQLAPDAIGFWNRVGDDIRAQRLQGVSPIDEHLGKLQSLMSRLAAIFHVLESDSPFVSLSALQRAWQVVACHIHHYQRAFAPPLPPPPPKQVEQDAWALVNLLRGKFSGVGNSTNCIKVKACAVRLNMTERRVLHVASILEDRGQVAISANGEAIDFRGLMCGPSYITNRF